MKVGVKSKIPDLFGPWHLYTTFATSDLPELPSPIVQPGDVLEFGFQLDEPYMAFRCFVFMSILLLCVHVAGYLLPRVIAF